MIKAIFSNFFASFVMFILPLCFDLFVAFIYRGIYRLHILDVVFSWKFLVVYIIALVIELFLAKLFFDQVINAVHKSEEEGGVY